MSASTAWLTVLIAGAGCYVLRISMVALLDGRQPSPTTTRFAGYVMPAAFAALAAAGLFHAAEAGAGDAAIAVVGAAVTTLVAIRTKSSNAALMAGLAAAGLATAIGTV